MKYIVISIVILSFCSCVQHPDGTIIIPDIEEQLEDTTIVEPNKTPYDSILAQELDADEYGMKQYVMAFLKVGPNRSQDSTTRANLQRAHLNNITRLANEGVLVLAGPFIDEGDIRGIYVFDVETMEEAKALTETDPAVEAGSLVMELHPWYGSAALLEVNDIHSKIAKINI